MCPPGAGIVIRIIEPLIQGWTHVPVNAALVDILCRAFPHETICFAAEFHHLAAVRREVEAASAKEGPGGRSRVVWEVIPGRNHARGCRGFILSRVGGGDFLVLTHINPSLLFFIKGFAALRGCRCQVVLHSNLNRIQGWRSRNPFIRWRDLKSALGFPLARNRIQYIVLENAIRESLLERIPRLAGRVAVLEHPIPMSTARGTKALPSSPLTIGFVGLCSLDRGFLEFLHIAETLGDRVAFHAVGALASGVDVDLSPLALPPHGEKLDRAVFVTRLLELDFICMPYPPEAYTLSASGVLLDAVAAGIPTIAYPFPILEDLVRRYGDIGHICHSRGEMVDLISSLADGVDGEGYKRQRKNLAAITRDRENGALSPAYRAGLGRFIPGGR